MQKQIDVTGPNGTFTGFVEVWLKHTVDLGPSKMVYHRIISRAYGILPFEQLIAENKDIWKALEQAEAGVVEQLKYMANHPTASELEKELKAKGFI